MERGIFPAFARAWRERTGEQVFFPSSFAGSGTITNQILLGAPAAVAILAHEGDAERLRAAGEITTDWRRFPARGVMTRTPFVILVRTGNPLHIRSFADLTRPEVGIVHPDPLTSGGALWAILAEFASALPPAGLSDPDALRLGEERLKGIWHNVVGQSPSAVGARTQFENGFGDALVTYEQQGLNPRGEGPGPEMVIPERPLLSEHLVVLVDHNIHHRDRELAEAFIEFLFSRDAQARFVSYGFRSAIDPALETTNPVFAPLVDPITIDELGGWSKACDLIVEGIWKGRVLKELGT
jgi:sulfate transport system substrate-binding protein